MGQEEIWMDIGGRTQTGRMSVQISGTAQTLDCGTLFLMAENFRRQTIDYEILAETAEAMVQIAFIQIMLNKFIE